MLLKEAAHPAGADTAAVLEEYGWEPDRVDALFAEVLDSHQRSQSRVGKFVDSVEIWQATGAIINFDPNFREYLEQIGRKYR